MIRIHDKLRSSSVNGPGKRAVVWVQGCEGMNCPGCWNPDTHNPKVESACRVSDIADWIMQIEGIDGVTFSGGEPMQQADALCELIWTLKIKRPGFSVGMYTGYTQRELDEGHFLSYRAVGQEVMESEYVKTCLWRALRPDLDFAVMGRYNKLKPTNNLPLVSSGNQKLELFSSRYKLEDFKPQSFEVFITGDRVQITGFPPPAILEKYKQL